MHVTIVGSGTLLPDDDHRSAGHVVESDRAMVLLDCGAGVLHGMAGRALDWAAISHVVISHFHTDHFADLAPLLWAWRHGVPEERQRPRWILGPRGIRNLLRTLAEAHGDFVLEPGFPLSVIELDPGIPWEDESLGLRIEAHSTRHTPESLAFRLELDGVEVGYTGDTGPHPPLGHFFKGMRLLISECAVSDSTDLENHLSPSSLAELAVAADPETLVVTHMYPEVDRARLPDFLRSLGYTGTIHLGEDGLRISLPAPT